MSSKHKFKRVAEQGLSLDALDCAIVEILHENPRCSNAELARTLGVAKTTIGLRINKLYENNAIRVIGVVNPVKAGYQITAWVRVLVRNASPDKIAEEIARLPEIMTVVACTGKYQLFLSVMARNVQHLGKILTRQISAIEGVEHTTTTVCLDTLHSNLSARYLKTEDLSVESRLQELNATDLRDTHDLLDRQILAELQVSARINFRELARKYEVPESTMRARINRLELRGEVCFTLISNPLNAGLGSSCLLMLTASAGDLQNLIEVLLEFDQLQLVALSAGHADIVAVAIAKNREELYDFVNREILTIDGIIEGEMIENLQSFKHLSGWGRIGSVPGDRKSEPGAD